jgi:uncharacterized protein
VNYPNYDPQSAVTPLTDAEIAALDTLLQTLPADGVMSLDGLDGYLTALLVGPPELLASVPSAEWLPLVWGGDDAADPAAVRPFASNRQRKSTVVLVLRHLRHLSHQLQHAPDDWEPIFSVAEFGKGADLQEWADARDWCTGFLQAVDLLPSAWDGLWDDPALGPALTPLLTLGGGLAADSPAAADAGLTPELAGTSALDDPSVCDALSRAVPDAVLRLLARFAAQPQRG